MPSPSATTPRSKPVLLLFGGIFAATLLVGLVATFRVKPAPLLVHCDTSLKALMTDVAAAYQRETGVHVELSLGDSEELLNNIFERRRGDLFLPANNTYIFLAHEKNLLRGTFPVAAQVTSLADEGNAKRVGSSAPARKSALDEPIAISVLKCSPQPEAAEKFARYVTAPEYGARHFLTHGFLLPAAR